MRQRKARNAAVPLDLLDAVADKLRPPVVVVLGAPREAAELVRRLPPGQVVCYQMDLYQAERLRDELARARLQAEVVTRPDLWDLPAAFATAVYPAPQGGERGLKIDMTEQAFHVLAPHGTFIVLSPYEKELFFPPALKKVFGRVHAPAAGNNTVFWCPRDGDRPRRRHEITFHARASGSPSLTFLSRPGTFAYGRFDEGARALVETMTVAPGDRVVDLGCGCGTNGIFAGRRSGGPVAFVDSNVRAVALADLNARANGLENFQTVASSQAEGLPDVGCDVVLANPPYYAQDEIAALFIARARAWLRPGGRLYLVTKRPNQVGPLVAEAFGPTIPVERRGYVVLAAERPGR